MYKDEYEGWEVTLEMIIASNEWSAKQNKTKVHSYLNEPLYKYRLIPD